MKLGLWPCVHQDSARAGRKAPVPIDLEPNARPLPSTLSSQLHFVLILVLDHTMTGYARHCFLARIALTWLAGCDRLSPDTYWRSERYVLLAVDAKGQMNLSFDQ